MNWNQSDWKSTCNEANITNSILKLRKILQKTKEEEIEITNRFFHLESWPTGPTCNICILFLNKWESNICSHFTVCPELLLEILVLASLTL